MAFRTRWFSSKLVNTDGYFVQPVNRGTIRYDDATGEYYVSAEMLATGGYVLYPQDIRIGSETGAPLRDEARRELIVQRVKAAFAFLGRPLAL